MEKAENHFDRFSFLAAFCFTRGICCLVRSIFIVLPRVNLRHSSRAYLVLLTSDSRILFSIMRRLYFIAILLSLACPSGAQAQNKTTPTPTPSAQRSPTKPSTPAPQQQQQQQQQSPPRQAVFDLSEVGVQIRPEPRLIVMMAALDAAGFDPTPQGEDMAVFRAQLRKDQANLDPELRQRLVTFYRRNKLSGPDGKELPPVEQSARYVSLAYALGSAPSFEEPPRSDDLPAGLLEVMDFAPLLREFYRKSGIDERMPTYLRSYQVEGDGLRRSTVEMVRGVLSYLNTRPVTTTIERIPVTAPTPPAGGGKKNVPMKYETREHERRFFIVPDLLAAPGAINFRVIADDYFITVPYCDETKHICAGRDNNPLSPEVRRAYIQYVVDPLVGRFTRDIAARKEQIKLLIDERAKAGAEVSPDVFRTIARSLSTATDVRIEESLRLAALSNNARSRLDKMTDPGRRAEIVKELETARAALTDESIAQLAEGYENGAVLDFYFAEQLRGVESSGFDIGNSLADMIASFDAAREMRRLAEADAARKRAYAARKARETQGDTTAALASLPNAALVKKLLEVDNLVQLKNYAAAEERLLALLREFPEEPRIFFSLAETASFSARDATDEDVQSARLNKALINYRNAVARATDDTDRCMLLRAHEAMGRILEFLDRKDEALKEYDAAIQINERSCEAYARAVEEKKKLSPQQR
jgi:tetratricopeptide (TPR) repeat protein